MHPDRLQQITRCTDEMAACRASYATADDTLLVFMGEMDWLTELHTQIHEVTQ